MKKFIYLAYILLTFNTLASTESINFRLLKLTQNISDLDTANKANPLKNDRENIEVLKGIIQKTNEFLTISDEFSKSLVQRLEDDQSLQGDDLSTIDNMVRTLMIVADFNMAIVNEYYKNLEQDDTFQTDSVQNKLGALIALGGSYNIFNLFNETYKDYFSNSALRRIVVDVYKTKAELYPSLKKVQEHFQTIDNKKFRELLTTWSLKFQDARIPLLKLLNPDITRALVTVESQQISNVYLSTEYKRFKYVKASDFIMAIIGKISNFISGLFGNLVGSIHWRKGFLDGHEWGATYLEKNLRPLDIIAEKTPFAATDLFIPGHFGHIALYLGTEEQLRELGLWNHPVIAPHQESIRNGKVILESIRPGSGLKSIRDFMKIDEITIIRQNNIFDNKYLALNTYQVAFEQLGKKYDFNFDVHTLDKVVCSEVVYHSYGHIHWPTAYIFGRHTISPDDVISLAFWDKSPVNFEISVIANKEKEIRNISAEEMAKNLSFKLNKSRSEETGTLTFDKEYKKCITVRKRDFSANNGIKYKNVRSCSTDYKQLVYGQ